MEIHKRRRIFL